jgi:hypothetical protein
MTDCKIKIAGFQVNVKDAPNLMLEKDNEGEYAPLSQEIKIDPLLTAQKRTAVLIHELLEAVNDIYKLDLDHDNQLHSLSVAIHQIITDNDLGKLFRL